MDPLRTNWPESEIDGIGGGRGRCTKSYTLESLTSEMFDFVASWVLRTRTLPVLNLHRPTGTLIPVYYQIGPRPKEMAYRSGGGAGVQRPSFLLFVPSVHCDHDR